MEPKWGLGPIWGEDGSGEEKKVPGATGLNPFRRSFSRLWGTFSMPFFNVFLEGVFFGPWATFGRQRCPKGSQNGAKMEAKAILGAPSGKCKKHGRGYVCST